MEHAHPQHITNRRLNRRSYVRNMAAVATLLATPAWAQSKAGWRSAMAWPAGPVNLIVPFPEGGGSATLAKILAQAFERQTRYGMRLQYLGGAGGLQGSSFAAKAPANGQHLLIAGSHLALARALVDEEAFDPLDDLRPLAMLAKVPQVLLVNPARLRARTMAELRVELMRKPSRYRMATAGVGSSSHVVSEILKQQGPLHFDLVHFRGAGPALQDLMQGTVDMMVDSVASCLPHIRAGRVRALMVTGPQAVQTLPGVLAAVEAGVEDLQAVTWYGLFAPAHLPVSKAHAIEQVLVRIGADARLQHDFQELGIQWAGLYGQAFEGLLQQDTYEWAQRLKRLGLQGLADKDNLDA